MLRLWPILLCAAALCWLTRLAELTRGGGWRSLALADLLEWVGLPAFHPSASEWGSIVAQLLNADAGMVFLGLTLAALVIENLTARPRG